jgi:hypothetical protein
MGDAGHAPDLDGAAYSVAIEGFLAGGDLDIA